MRLTDEQFAWATAEYGAGQPLEALAEKLPCSRQALWERMKRAGVIMRPQQRHGAENHFYRGGEYGADWAHNKVETALKRGEMVRPPVCSECAGAGPVYNDGRSAVQAHHDDYNAPLDVRWLCQPCHHEWHKHHRAVPLRDGPEGGDAQGSLFVEVEPVDLIVGGFPLDPARELALPASARASATPRPFCGARCGEPLASLSHDTSSSRMWRTSSLSMTEPSGERFSGTWPRSGSMLSGTVYRRQPSTPLTAVTGSLPLLRTPNAALIDPKSNVQKLSGRSPSDPQVGLADQVLALLPTPVKSDGESKRGSRGAGSVERGGGQTLRGTLVLLPTPAAGQHNYDEDPEQWQARAEKLKEKGINGNGAGMPLPVALKLLPSPRANDGLRLRPSTASEGWGKPLEQIAMESLSSGEPMSPPSDAGKRSTAPRLSPLFVEWMMGAPSGWTDPDCPLLATEFRSKLATPSGDT